MTFNSFGFLIFFPIVLALHFLLPLKIRWIALLIASYYFYISWNPELIYLIVFTTLVSYVSGLVIHKSKSRATRRFWLVLTLVVCLGILFFYKYFNFLSTSVTEILRFFSLPVNDFTLDLILPVGISFYTFQTLSYVIDVYRGSIEPERHFGYYALYVSFFPQLVAGPIERPENLIPPLKVKHVPNPDNFREGLKIMICGFFKKLAVADILAPYVNSVFNNPDESNALSVIIASCLFAVQIYCDFSGYTDIAIGCARIMGIRLMQNFNMPYMARTIKEFWARWHISLSSWFRDYVYIPLGGNRCSSARQSFNVFVVFLLSGIWHGANWTFVLWGVLHGMYQIVGKVTLPLRKKVCAALHINREASAYAWWERFVTFVLVGFAWIFFRANNLSDLGTLISRLFTGWGGENYWKTSLSLLNITPAEIIVVILSIIIMNLLDILIMQNKDSTRFNSYDGKACVRDNSYVYLLMCIGVAWLVLLAGGGASSFIYFQF